MFRRLSWKSPFQPWTLGENFFLPFHKWDYGRHLLGSDLFGAQIYQEQDCIWTFLFKTPPCSWRKPTTITVCSLVTVTCRSVLYCKRLLQGLLALSSPQLDVIIVELRWIAHLSWRVPWWSHIPTCPTTWSWPKMAGLVLKKSHFPCL